MSSTRRSPADAAEVLAFLQQVMNGEPIQAALRKNSDHAEPVFPTLDQRLRATLTLLNKLDVMQKQLTDTADAETQFTFTAKDIEEMRAAMLGKLAGLAAPTEKKRSPRKPRAGGSGAAVS